jgi:prepilin-type N-terminal cleavage/methylation domain-containing protein
MNKGFTLLEILVALAILSISMLALYNLLNFSLDLHIYSKNRVELVNRGYESVIRQLNFDENINTIKNEYDNITFDLEINSTIIPDIQEYRLLLENEESSITYRFFNENE